MSKKHFITTFLLSILSIGAFSSAFIANANNSQKVEAAIGYQNGDADTYYKDISDTLTGDALLAKLRTLNSNRRKDTVGYSAMGTTPSGKFKYTDYDPSSVKYDGNGQPYGTRLISFYSGNSAVSGMNREHVWPDSHGGNKVESDIHMPRPTLTAENGSRGNSFYVEGMKSQSLGWDPAMESFGDETYRGDSARIIFYCVVADSRLSLIDATYHSTSKNNNDNLMGKLSDMLKWNLEYPVLQRERNRNEGAEYLQGNRNPFIDHPEYACKIWGNFNEDTKKICQGHLGEDDPSIRIAGTLEKTEYDVGDYFDPTGLTVIYSSGVKGEADIDVTTKVTWNPMQFTTPGKITITCTYNSLVAIYGTVTVKDQVGDAYLDISGELVKTEYDVGDYFDPTGLTVTYHEKDDSLDVTNKVTWNPMQFTTPGKITITCEYEGLTAVYGTVMVKDPASDAYLDISGELVKSTYEVGDWLDPTGLTVTYHEKDEAIDITNKVMWDPMQFESSGMIELKAIYNELVCVYGVVEVKEKGHETSSEESNEDTSSDSSSTPTGSDSSDSGGHGGGGGCSASIGGSSSIVFIGGLVALFFAIRKLIKINKEEK